MQDDGHTLKSTGEACANCWYYRQAWKCSSRNPAVGGESVKVMPAPMFKPAGHRDRAAFWDRADGYDGVGDSDSTRDGDQARAGVVES